MGMAIAEGACRGGVERAWERRTDGGGEGRHSPSGGTWSPAAADKDLDGEAGGVGGHGSFDLFERGGGFKWTRFISNLSILLQY